MEDKLLSVKQLAEVLNIPVSRVYGFTRMKGKNAMPKIMVGKYCRFELDNVMDWLKAKNENDY